MSEDLFPSGPWVGFYNYGAGQEKHRMDLDLEFTGGIIKGYGADDVGRFTIQGNYHPESRECYWTKNYPGSHDVFYKGFREGKGIWGTWEIGQSARGGFHIWPCENGQTEDESESEQETEPVNAISTDVWISIAGGLKN